MDMREYRALLTRNELTQAQAAWMCGVGVRHARSWALGKYPVPQYAALILSAYDEGLIGADWLISRIARPLP
jgi:hypothetical protein